MDERGSALVIALIFIGVWALVIIAILGFSETGFNLAAGSAGQRDDAYAADGAVDAAISHLAWGGAAGDCPSHLFEIDDEPAIAVEVECTEIGADPRVVELVATIDGSDRLTARVELGEDSDPPDPPVAVDIWRWMVIR